MSYKMALDFDETIVESLRAVSNQCLKRNGFRIPEHVYYHTDWKNAPMTEAEFSELVLSSIVADEWTKKVMILDGALAGIVELINCGVEIDILTARGLYPGEIEAARYVCARYNINFRIIGTSYRPKKHFLDGHSVVLDDQIREIADMPSDVHRLLLRRPHNEKVWCNPSEGVVPVNDWPHAVATIKTLLDL